MSTIALITGANSGLGLATAQALAHKGFDLIFLVRSREKGEQARKQILEKTPQARIDLFFADLTNMDSIRQVCQQIHQKYDRLDCLINNAGYAPAQLEFTRDGYEKSFVANHLGHFLLTLELIDLLKASGKGRIINLSSAAHAMGKSRRFFLKHNSKMNIWSAYGDGKLANLLFTVALANRLKGQNVSAYAVHPGVVNTQFGRNFTDWWKYGFGFLRPFMITTEEGAQTSIYLATADLPESYNGGYFSKSKPARILNKDVNDYNAQLLWKRSEEALGERWML
ncbi:SDR family NAD(P)-dependent oxidoreductase [Siphonobacter sp. SORGH_AS_1065]|uniref:SDR family NAD(P)-dependent oxidoreductase n=1 Tax=Siphonobacter sp. SORGH_AS_1065 TaxID=3041795 RepID=UPI00278BA5F9|nr:SDR family NAD(P)-dependent oxidoreductase [Siphonobacter sp. SORGH_AS_1065]MDQ1086190.1 retinol dehydrogenase-12 [Siphonobacter sp. SORGH_AS_1065]